MTDDEIIELANQGGYDFVVIDAPYGGDGEPFCDIVITNEVIAWVRGTQVVRFASGESEAIAREWLEGAAKSVADPSEVDMQAAVDRRTTELLECMCESLAHHPVVERFFEVEAELVRRREAK